MLHVQPARRSPQQVPAHSPRAPNARRAITQVILVLLIARRAALAPTLLLMAHNIVNRVPWARTAAFLQQGLALYVQRARRRVKTGLRVYLAPSVPLLLLLALLLARLV